MSLAPLTVESCDLLQSDNAKRHHTDEYEADSTRLVARRGQAFSIRLTLSRDTEFPSDSIRFEFQIGSSPRTTQKSRIFLNPIDAKAGDAAVGVVYSSLNTGNILDVKIQTPSDMGVGQWDLFMYSKHTRARREIRSRVSDDIVMLFNAWNKADDVYMENEKWRQEYVLNDEGRLYYGSVWRIGGMDWYFGQFEKEVLDAALKLVRMGRLLYRDRGSAVSVSRHMSALVNANDDNGVLVGNWSGEYDDGTDPSAWVGSYSILKQYLEKGEPVLYGQCWVFSGVLCAVLRALGIPARSVTNFESAHDTDANLTIDYHYDERGNSMDNDDSVWNFHVWNDVWMARPDLAKGFGGWQALDATPQEESSGKMRCGPMPISAIKQGLIYMDYDGPFIYAEVNGTKRHWKRRKGTKDEWDPIGSDTDDIGRHLSTKQVGNDLREDVTHIYKYAEGSPEEKLSFKTARKYVTFSKSERKVPKEVVKFTADIPASVPFGEDVPVTFKFTNTSSEPQSVFLAVICKVMQYNGSVVAKIHDVDLRAKIDPGKTKEVSTTVTAKSYLGKVKSNSGLKIFAIGGVESSRSDEAQSFVYHGHVEFDKPAITVSATSETLKLGESTTVNISFTNPLSTALEAGILRVEGSGFSGVVELPVSKIKAGATYSKTFTVTPRRLGKRKVLFGFSSPSLTGLLGSITLTVVSPAGRRA